MSVTDPYEAAKTVRSIYAPGCEFPSWVLEPAHWATHAFSETRVFYNADSNFEDVVRMATEREPCNIGMRRLYNRYKLGAAFGYEIGAYSKGEMPTIGIYCNATVRSERTGKFRRAHVINLVGLAFDDPAQPDYKAFNDRPTADVVDAYSRMWLLAAAAAKDVPGIRRIKLYNVGGGAFSGKFEDRFTEEIFEPAFATALPAFKATGIEIAGYDWSTRRFNGGEIPGVLDTDDLTTTLYVNAWDPWSLIGNGNECDFSLDGAWGRISNMAVLGWRKTNPAMQFVAVRTAVPS